MGNNDHGRFIGQTLYSSDNEKVGKIGQVFLDDDTDRPEFLTVNTGLFGMSESFVPAADADVNGDGVHVPFTKDQVKDAPNVDVANGHLDQSEERRLYEHYGLTYSERSSDSGLPEGGTTGTTGTTGTGASSRRPMPKKYRTASSPARSASSRRSVWWTGAVRRISSGPCPGARPAWSQATPCASSHRSRAVPMPSPRRLGSTTPPRCTRRTCVMERLHPDHPTATRAPPPSCPRIRSSPGTDRGESQYSSMSLGDVRSGLRSWASASA